MFRISSPSHRPGNTAKFHPSLEQFAFSELRLFSWKDIIIFRELDISNSRKIIYHNVYKKEEVSTLSQNQTTTSTQKAHASSGQSSLSRILAYAGGYKILTVLGCVLSAIAAILGLGPYICVWLVARHILDVYPAVMDSSGLIPVSYTHLDVYKRQHHRKSFCQTPSVRMHSLRSRRKAHAGHRSRYSHLQWKDPEHTASAGSPHGSSAESGN